MGDMDTYDYMRRCGKSFWPRTWEEERAKLSGGGVLPGDESAPFCPRCKKETGKYHVLAVRDDHTYYCTACAKRDREKEGGK